MASSSSSSRPFTVTYSSQPRNSNPPPPGFKYIWEGIIDEYPMELPPPIQNPDACAFATTSSQAQLDFTIRHARYGHPKYGHLFHPQFDHFKWERDVRATKPEQATWEAYDLLKRITDDEVDFEEIKVVADEVERCGLEVVDSGRAPDSDDPILTHRVSTAHKYDNPNYEFVKELLLENRAPLIAKVPIIVGYPEFHIGHDVKTGYRLPYMFKDDVTETYLSHTLLLVGVYEAQPNDPYGLLPSRNHYLYQDSLLEGMQDHKEDKSLLGNGMSILDSALVDSISYSLNYPPPALVKKPLIPEVPYEVWKMKSHHGYVKDKRFWGMRYLKQATIPGYANFKMPPPTA